MAKSTAADAGNRDTFGRLACPRCGWKSPTVYRTDDVSGQSLARKEWRLHKNRYHNLQPVRLLVLSGTDPSLSDDQ